MWRKPPSAAELHVIAGVVPATRQVAADIRAVLHAGVTAPVEAVGGRQVAGALCLIEQQRLLQGLTVVEGLCEQLRREHRHEHREDAGNSRTKSHVVPPVTSNKT
jgi:hypothetical protein